VPDKIHIDKFDAYGTFLKETSVTTAGTGTPRGFVVDALGDMFLLFDQLTPTYNASTILDGWNASGTSLFSKTLAPPSPSTSVNGLGICTDSSNNLYLAELAQGSPAGALVYYTKFSRTGVQAFSTNESMYSSYVLFGSDGRCSALGYDYKSGGGLAGAHAVVLSPVDGSVLFRKQIAYTASNSYYFGGGNFDEANNFYLNTVATIGSTTTTTINAFNKSFANIWQSPSVPGFAWYGAAKDPSIDLVWGSSDVYNSTGEFFANVGGGVVHYNNSTFGDKVMGLWVDDPELITLGGGNPDGDVTILNIDKNGIATAVQKRRPPMGGLADVGAGVYMPGSQSYIGTFSFKHMNPPTPGTPASITPSPYGCYLYATRQGILLNAIGAPTKVKSGASFTVNVASNVKLTTGSIVVSLKVTNGLFSNGLTTENVTLSAPNQLVKTTVNTSPSNTNKTLTIQAKQGGVYRLTSTIETAPAITTVAVSQTVTAAGDTTDPFTVTLDGQAAAGGIGVTITSSNTAVIPNTSATVLQNQTSVSGSLVVHKVTSQQIVNVTFKTSTGSTVTKAITVNP